MNRYRQILQSATEFAVIVTDRDGTITEWNTGAERILGWSAPEIVGRHASRFFTPEDRAADRVATEMADAQRDGRGIDERWHMKADGSRFWASGEMMPLRDDAGAPVGFVKILRDRTEQHREGERLRDLEGQLRQALEAGGVGLCTVDVETGVLAATPGFSRIYGLEHRDERPADDFGALVIPEDRHLVSSHSTRRAGVAPTDVVYRIRRPDDGALRWIERKGDYQRDEGGRPVRFVGTARDVTEQMTNEERRATLNAELAHRLKNNLALVQSIATQTLRTAPDMATARQTLTARIGALSKAHDILLTGQRDAAPISVVVKTATALHDDGGRVHLSGPDVALGPKASLTLSLILHELSTNAGKYGALSVPDGRVDVEWTVADDPATRRPILTFDWREVGGPPVVPPTRTSFGTRLIGMGLSGAAESSSDLIYAPDGLRCRIVGSLTELQSESGDDA